MSSFPVTQGLHSRPCEHNRLCPAKLVPRPSNLTLETAHLSVQLSRVGGPILSVCEGCSTEFCSACSNINVSQFCGRRDWRVYEEIPELRVWFATPSLRKKSL
jgi:hypothetical protein